MQDAEKKQDESSQAVLAYRVSQVERAVSEGFKELKTEIKNMSTNFATHKDVEAIRRQAELEHSAIYEKIGDVEKEVNGLKKRNWVQNTLSAILGVVLTLLTTYAISQLFN